MLRCWFSHAFVFFMLNMISLISLNSLRSFARRILWKSKLKYGKLARSTNILTSFEGIFVACKSRRCAFFGGVLFQRFVIWFFELAYFHLTWTMSSVLTLKWFTWFKTQHLHSPSFSTLLSLQLGETMKQNARIFVEFCKSEAWLEAWKPHAINPHLPLLLERGSIPNYNIQIFYEWCCRICGAYLLTNDQWWGWFNQNIHGICKKIFHTWWHGAYGICMISLNINIPMNHKKNIYIYYIHNV